MMLFNLSFVTVALLFIVGTIDRGVHSFVINQQQDGNRFISSIITPLSRRSRFINDISVVASSSSSSSSFHHRFKRDHVHVLAAGHDNMDDDEPAEEDKGNPTEETFQREIVDEEKDERDEKAHDDDDLEEEEEKIKPVASKKRARAAGKTSSKKVPSRPSEQEEPSAEDDVSIKDQCLEWYKQQPGARKKPLQKIMMLFEYELSELQSLSVKTLTRHFFKDEEMAKAFVKFLKPDSSGKREGSLKDRCIEWYKQQPGAQEKPTEKIMMLFGQNLEELQTKSTNYIFGASVYFFDNNKEMTKAFVKFLKPGGLTPVKSGTIAAFRSNYVDASDSVVDFIQYIDECQKEYRTYSTQYNSPCTSLCQSSGYGKSRLLEQVAQKRKLLYICVGDSDPFFPRPNLKARNFLFSENVVDEVGRVDHLRKQLKRCISWCKQNDLTKIDQFGITPADFWNDIIDDATVIEPDSNVKNNETILIAFDEARSLLQVPKGKPVSDFRILRQALDWVSRDTEHQIFAILVDTTPSIIAKVSPPSSNFDPRALGQHSFHPYILLSTHDALKDPLAKFTDDWSFVNCGRPLWKSLFPKHSISSKDMIKFAAQKLIKSLRLDGYKDDLQLLAMIICRTGVYLSPQSSTTSELAANYMATMLLSDSTREHFLVTYLSDPVLTIGSAHLWHKKDNNDLLVTRALPVLRQKLVHGAVVNGYLSELVGRLLLLLGMDSTSKDGSYDGGWYKVSDFMKCCFGITDCLADEEAYMGFSHFIPLVEEPKSYQVLQELLYRRGAGCLPPGQDGADLLIPFWKKTEAEQPSISYMLVQVQNNKDEVLGDEMLRKLNPKVCFSEGNPLREPSTDIILIMMEIGSNYKGVPKAERFISKKEPPTDKPQDKWKDWVYSVRGIYSQSYPFLRGQDKLRDELVRLRRAPLNMEEWMAVDESKDALRTSSPPMAMRRKHLLKVRPKIVIAK